MGGVNFILTVTVKARSDIDIYLESHSAARASYKSRRCGCIEITNRSACLGCAFARQINRVSIPHNGYFVRKYRNYIPFVQRCRARRRYRCTRQSAVQWCRWFQWPRRRCSCRRCCRPRARGGRRIRSSWGTSSSAGGALRSADKSELRADFLVRNAIIPRKRDPRDLYVCILTELEPVAAVRVEYVVALVDFPVERVEDQTVRAELLHGLPVDALVVLVTLLRVLELAVVLWALEHRACKGKMPGYANVYHDLFPLMLELPIRARAKDSFV